VVHAIALVRVVRATARARRADARRRRLSPGVPQDSARPPADAG